MSLSRLRHPVISLAPSLFRARFLSTYHSSSGSLARCCSGQNPSVDYGSLLRPAALSMISGAHDSSLKLKLRVGFRHFSFAEPPSHTVVGMPAISPTMYLLRSKSSNVVQSRNFSSYNKNALSIEEEAERKIGWLLKFIFVGTAIFVAYQFFPYMGDNLVQQSVSLLQVKDPFFKRSGASRLARFAVDDEKRMKIVEMGGAHELINMLKNAKDDSTRIAALKALVALSLSDEAVGALNRAGAISVIKSTTSEEVEIKNYKSSLLKRFQDLGCDS